jgi:2,3-bisphosphoglycerate-dependent phosphoglycerate mutase
MPDLLMMRHGQSSYNLENRFTGVVDVPLSSHGIEEAQAAAQKLKDYHIDIAFTSTLIRAIDTLHIVLDKLKDRETPIIKSEALNERNYGELQGLNKADTMVKYGEEQVNLWRRGYTERPPGGESLKDTEARVMPYFNETIREKLKQGLNVLIVAHGNSLRAIVKNLDNISDVNVADLNIATGSIYRYRFDSDLKIVNRMTI